MDNTRLKPKGSESARWIVSYVVCIFLFSEEHIVYFDHNNNRIDKNLISRSKPYYKFKTKNSAVNSFNKKKNRVPEGRNEKSHLVCLFFLNSISFSLLMFKILFNLSCSCNKNCKRWNLFVFSNTRQGVTTYINPQPDSGYKI